MTAAEWVDVSTRDFPDINSSELERLHGRIGKPTRDGSHITEVNADAVRHWCHGVGETNPLWLDVDYARTSSWGRQVAPPSFVFPLSDVLGGYVGALPGVHAWYGGTYLRINDYIPMGYKKSTRAFLKSLERKEGAFAKTSYKQTYQVDFLDEAGNALISGESWTIRTERVTARKVKKYGGFEPKTWNQDELDEVWAWYESERPRGGIPLMWEDVAVGDDIPQILKGPYTTGTFVAFAMGYGLIGYVKAHAHVADIMRNHPGIMVPNEQNVPEPIAKVHWDNSWARMVGYPCAYDAGPERVSWASQVVTDWIGDAGRMKELYVEVREPNIVGDITWVRGKVTEKQQSPSENLVKCEIWQETQDGRVHSRGWAVAALPSKAPARG